MFVEFSYVLSWQLKNFQEKLAKDIIGKLPNKKLQGSYHYSWYRYEYIREGYESRDYYSWKNFNDFSYSYDLKPYDQTKAGNFKWSLSYDDEL